MTRKKYICLIGRIEAFCHSVLGGSTNVVDDKLKRMPRNICQSNYGFMEKYPFNFRVINSKHHSIWCLCHYSEHWNVTFAKSREQNESLISMLVKYTLDHVMI